MKKFVCWTIMSLFLAQGFAFGMTADNYFQRGTEEAGRGDYEQALKDYTRAIELKPDYEKAYNNRGNANRHLGNFSQAIQDYTRAMELKPDYWPVYNNLAWLYATCSDQTFRDGKKAVQFASKAVAMQGTPGQLDTLGAAYVEDGQPERAFAAYTEAMKKDSRYIKTYQKSLKAKGYYSGNTDGIYTQQLETAMRGCIADGRHL